MAIVTAGPAGINFDDLKVSDLELADVTVATATAFTLKDGPWLEEFTGTFTYSGTDLAGGTVTGWRESLSGQTTFQVTGMSVPAVNFLNWAQTNNNEAAKATILSGNDQINGSAQADRMFGYTGNDTLVGGGGEDYLRGNEGDDSINGGAAFDDVHGNQGNDTVDGGLGGDWVVGGQGDDMLLGGADTEFNIIYGNLGADTCIGSAGGDWLRGGQQNDSLSGGAGNDLLWGDKGDDTLAGGAGADTFNVFGEAGVDRIIDFNAGEGDRLHVEAGYTYVAHQVGADVVVDISGGAQVTLVGATLSALPNGWIYLG